MDAACRGLDIGIFFPEPGDRSMVKVAKEICMSCDVRVECLAEALEVVKGRNEYHTGIRGGLTPDERRGYNRPRHPSQKCPVCGVTVRGLEGHLSERGRCRGPREEREAQ